MLLLELKLKMHELSICDNPDLHQISFKYIFFKYFFFVVFDLLWFCFFGALRTLKNILYFIYIDSFYIYLFIPREQITISL